ncbi:MAG TPA: TlpA disulfide reductase family protein [Gemmatimonadales bacterium]|nr:TlpA disulfide reductase family protein [Gemmatimonadales bacterium]
MKQWLVVALAIAGLGLGAWGLSRYAPPPEGVTMGNRAPDYRVPMAGSTDSISLREHYAGQVTLVNIWATWCLPCRAEMPSMQEVYADYRDRGFRIAAVSVDAGSSDKVIEFGRELGLTFDLLHDASGGIQQTFRTIGVPQSFLLDRDGVVQWIELGEEDWRLPQHRERIERLLDD